MQRAPVCRYCKAPVRANAFSGPRTVYVHPRCLLQRARELDRNPEQISPLARALAQAMLRGQTRSRPPRPRTSQKPYLRLVK
jgi:hypothetical protein